MSASAAQLQFAAEFVLFLAAASGLAVVALRGELLSTSAWGRASLAAGFLALGTAAFLHGTLREPSGDLPLVVGLRVGGVAAVAAGSIAWAAGAASRRLLLAGLGLVGAAAWLDLGGNPTAAGVLLAVGAAGLSACMVVASRRSIAARVAASAAATLLIVVLVLAVALSAVLNSTVRQGMAERLQGRVANEAFTARNTFTARLADAKVVAAVLADATRIDKLVAVADVPRASNALSPDLQELSQSYLSNTGLAYVARSGKVQGAAGLNPAVVVALPESEPIRQALATKELRGSVAVLSGRALSIGVVPIPSTAGLLGAVAAVSRLDRAYLTRQSADDRDLSLALVTAGGTVASAGRQPPAGRARALVEAALADGRPRSAVIGARFVAVAPVEEQTPVLAMVASTPTTLVNDTRNTLFRNLFLIALGGTLLALLLTTLVGERIGAGLRRLTVAAEGIQRGNLAVRAGMRSDDEVGVLASTFDSMAASVQEKTAIESRLRSRLEAVVEGMGEALVAVDADGRITDFNQAAEELVGVVGREARGRPVEEVVSLVSDEGTPLHPLGRASPTRWSAQGWVERADGSRVPVGVSAGALRGVGGELVGTVLVLRDLRREREVEQMKTEFLSRIGHELRTPLTGVIGYADLLTRKRVPAERAHQWHVEILNQSKVLLRIVKMLEFFASTGAGRVILRPEQVDVRAVVDEVVHRWSEKVDDSVVIGRRVARDVPPVLADRGWLTLSLDELVDNAVKFSPNGGKIVVSADRADGRGVRISVADRGKGMSHDEEARAFADFVQGDSSDTRLYGGLGLGLALVQRVAEAHGGTVACESTLGKGSKFSIFLPNVPMEKE